MTPDELKRENDRIQLSWGLTALFLSDRGEFYKGDLWEEVLKQGLEAGHSKAQFMAKVDKILRLMEEEGRLQSRLVDDPDNWHRRYYRRPS